MIFGKLKVTLVLVVVLMMVSIGAKAVGTFQPPNPALRGFVEGCEGQPQPCWYGIVPGVTTIEEAQSTILNLGLGYYVMSTTGDAIYFYSKENVECHIVYIVRLIEPFTLTLRDCDGFKLGDSFGLGSPEHIIKFPQDYPDFRISLNSFYTIFINPCDHCNIALSPDTPVNLVFFPDPGTLTSDNKWHGFVPKWRYCQLEPDFPECPN